MIAGLPADTHDSLESSFSWLIENWQTQATEIWPLEIPLGKFDKLSKISQNYTSYGYEKMTKKEIEQSQAARALSKTKSPHGETRLDFKNFLMWKTKNLNYFDARTLIEKFIDLKSSCDFRLNPFMLAQRFQNLADVDARLLLNRDYRDEKDVKLEPIDNYKNKKLNWNY